VDLVARGFDAGVHLGEFIERDMVTVRVSPDRRPAIVGSPAYFAVHPKPATPRDLTSHRCINFRHGPDAVYRWELDKGRQSLRVAVLGPLIVDDVELLIRAAVDGVGLAFMAEDSAGPHLASGGLVRVLEDWCPPYPGFFLYYPRQRRLAAALGALVETLRWEDT
jgi:DNA-binding transcriptional LysR family regulator